MDRTNRLEETLRGEVPQPPHYLFALAKLMRDCQDVSEIGYGQTFYARPHPPSTRLQQSPAKPFLRKFRWTVRLSQ